MAACWSIQCDFKISQSRHSSKTRVCWWLETRGQTRGLNWHELSYVWTHPNSQFAVSKQSIQPNQCHQTDALMFAPKCIAHVFDILVELTRSRVYSFRLLAEVSVNKMTFMETFIYWRLVFRFIFITECFLFHLKKMGVSSRNNLFILKWKNKWTNREADTSMCLHSVFWITPTVSEWIEILPIQSGWSATTYDSHLPFFLMLWNNKVL